MLAIEVEFLMGRAIAAHWEDRTQPEWPPHPQRLFSALVAAHAELDGTAQEEAALEWLENLPPPEIKADLYPSIRSRASYFVPVNDEAVKVDKDKLDPRHILERRNRQERYFPAVVPADSVVVFQWPDARDAERHGPALRRLVENLTYLGHSASPVRACIRSTPVCANLRPNAHGEHVLRTPGPGRLARLNSVYELRKRDETIQPPRGRTQRYTSAAAVLGSVFSMDAMVVAMEGGPKLSLDSTLPLMQHVRNALLARLGDIKDEILSGHDAAGKPTRDPHLAIAPLAFVNSRHADGSIKGVALILPASAPDATVSRLRSALHHRWELNLGPLGASSMQLLDVHASRLASLDFRKYAAPASVWATVTPVVLDRHPKKNGPSAEEIVSLACERIGLPAPVEVRVGSVSALRGAPPVPGFHGRAKQVDGRMRVHAWLRFDRPVRGPVLIGAGRFMGLGLCAPCKGALP